MKKTYKKIKSKSPTNDKITSTNDSKNKSAMIIKVSSTKTETQNQEESKNSLPLSQENITSIY